MLQDIDTPGMAVTPAGRFRDLLKPAAYDVGWQELQPRGEDSRHRDGDVLPCQVDDEGFDALDRRLLRIVIDSFDGGPVGVESLAAALSEERGTIEDVVEPFLIQQAYLMRTARGRMATAKAYRHFGLAPPRRADAPVADLFDPDSPGPAGTGTP